MAEAIWGQSDIEFVTAIYFNAMKHIANLAREVVSGASFIGEGRSSHQRQFRVDIIMFLREAVIALGT